MLAVCQTPLHFLLASLILRDITGMHEHNKIIWIEDTAIDPGFVSIVQEWANAEFIHLRGYGSRTQVNVPGLKQVKHLVNILRLKYTIKLTELDAVLIFHDSTPETQYLMHRVKQVGGCCILGEDGVAIYRTGGRLDFSTTKKVIARHIYGRWWNPQKYIGLNPMVDVIYATWPHCLRPEIQEKPVKQISPVSMDFTAILERYFLCSHNLREKTLVVFPLKSSVGDEAMELFIKSIFFMNTAVEIKLHPREELSFIEIEAMIKSIAPSSHWRLLPKYIPVELLCVGCLAPKAVIGFRSSSLHIIKRLSPGVNVYYFEVSDDSTAMNWAAFYKEVGVGSMNKHGDSLLV